MRAQLALPLVVHSVVREQQDKKKRNAARAARRESRVAERSEKRKSRADIGATDAPVGGATASAAGAGAGEAKADDVKVSVSDGQPLRRASAIGPVQKVGLNMSAAKSSAFASLDAQLTERDNPAINISFAAYLLSICIVITGPRTPLSVDSPADEQFFDAVIWTTIGVSLLTVANVINDRLIMFQILARQSLLDGNVATGLIEAGSYIAASLIVRATLTGESSEATFEDSLVVVLIYFALAEVALLISVCLLQAMTKYDDQKEASKGNAAAGFKFFGNIVSLGFIVSNPMTKTDSLVGFGLFFALGTLLLTLLRIFLDRVVLPGDRHIDDEIAEDQNWGVAMIEASISIFVAMCLTTFMPDIGCVRLQGT